MGPPSESRWNFPAPADWPKDDDVVAIGADLEPSTLLHAYAHGMFPMHLDKKHRTLGWWSPVERGVVPLDRVRVTRSLNKSARRFRCTVDTAFEQVMRACATSHTEGNWITDEFIDAYSRLHSTGDAHSVEVWNSDNVLVGGLYGVRINGFFAGESMFHLERDASKVAFVHLVNLMRLDGMTLFDTQWNTDHLATLGCTTISRDEYLALLAEAVAPESSSPRRMGIGIAILET